MGEVGVGPHRPAECWPDKIFAALGAAPDGAVAVTAGSEVLTYGALRRRLYETLPRPPGELRDVPVGVVASRSTGYAVGLLGLWACGAVPVVTEESWTVSERLDAWAAAGCAHWVDLAGDRPVVRAVAGGAEQRHLRGMSHVLFTSGSLGRPAASFVGTASFALAIGGYEAIAGMRPDDVVPMLSAPSHDPGLRDVLAPLLAGARLCVPPADAFAAPRRLAGWLAAIGASVLHVVPVRLRLLCHGLEEPLPSVRLVVSSGGVLTPRDARLVQRFFPEASLVNGYGLTETPQLVAFRRWVPSEIPDAGAAPDLPIGRPLPGCRVEVWPAEDGRPVPDGCAGELCVAEPHIAESGAAESGAGREGGGARFVTDHDGVRWCRTGDLGWLDERGELHFSGRMGRVQKVNGRRVDLDLVETVATSCPDVVVAVAQVAGRPDHDVVEVALRCEGAFSGVRAAVAARLEAAPLLRGVPWAFVDGSSVTLSPALKPVYGGAPAGRGAGAPSPQECVERILRVAEEVAGSPIDEHTTFADSGFSSEGLLQLAEALSADLGVEVPLLDLFRAPTPRALAAALSAAGERDPSEEPARRQLERAEQATARREIIRQVRTDDNWNEDRTA